MLTNCERKEYKSEFLKVRNAGHTFVVCAKWWLLNVKRPKKTLSGGFLLIGFDF